MRGFTPELWSRVSQRLEHKFPDHHPEDPYKLSEIVEAAHFVLAHLAAVTKTLQAPLMITNVQTLPAIVTPLVQTVVKVKDLHSMFEKLTETVAIFTSAVQVLHQNVTQMPLQVPVLAWHRYATPTAHELKRCNFCGSEGHFITQCASVEQYICDGKVCRNAQGKVVLPGGAYVPGCIQGHWL